MLSCFYLATNMFRTIFNCVVQYILTESVLLTGDTLIVGTKQGHMLVYTVRQAPGDTRFEVHLERSIKSFAKRPITQLEVIPEYHILVSISGNIAFSQLVYKVVLMRII